APPPNQPTASPLFPPPGPAPRVGQTPSAASPLAPPPTGGRRRSPPLSPPRTLRRAPSSPAPQASPRDDREYPPETASAAYSTPYRHRRVARRAGCTNPSPLLPPPRVSETQSLRARRAPGVPCPLSASGRRSRRARYPSNTAHIAH